MQAQPPGPIKAGLCVGSKHQVCTFKSREGVLTPRKLAAMERNLVLVLVLFGVVQALVPPPTLSHAEEWQMWKTQHGKSYGSVREELERHLVWLANREYINAHNQNSHIFGFTLAINHLGDIVSLFLMHYSSLSEV